MQYAVFYMAFGLIALDVILRLLLIEKKIARQWKSASVSEEVPAQPESISTEAEKSNEANPAESFTQPTATSPGPQFTPNKYPAVLTLLTSRRLLTALWGCVVQGALVTAFDSVVPLFVHRGK